MTKYLWTSSTGYLCVHFFDSNVFQNFGKHWSPTHDKNSHKLLISELKPNGITPLYCCPLSSSSVQLVEDVQQLDYPTSFIPWCCTLKCSCDGLVVIHVVDNIIDKRSIFLLWNPSTRESIVLPNPKTPLAGSICCLGLGYDSTSRDYKILQIDSNVRSLRASSQILALKSGRWRNIDKHPLVVWNLLSHTFSLAMVHEAFQMKCTERYHCQSKYCTRHSIMAFQ